MRALVVRQIAPLDHELHPLDLVDLLIPEPQASDTLIKVSACGFRHTEPDEIEGRPAQPRP